MREFGDEDLFPGARNPEQVQSISGRCLMATREGHRVVTVSGIALSSYRLGDRMSEAHAMVSLVEQGFAEQIEVAHAFGCSARTVRRHQRRFEQGGLAGLGCGSGYPSGKPRLSGGRVRMIGRLKARGHSGREIARRLGVSEKAIRKSLRRLGWKDAVAQQGELALGDAAAVAVQTPVCPADGGADPNLSASAAAALEAPPAAPTESADPNLSAFPAAAPQSSTFSLDADPADRRGDRLLARLGLLEDAAPLFGSGKAIAGAGVLLALPALVGSGIFACAARIYGNLGPAFFGLRTTLLTLLLMGLWRIKRPEGLKEHSPANLGRVLGLDRAPEVKTLRRKLAQFAALGRAAELGGALAQHRAAARGEALGFLYVDGHVRVYHGARRLPKAHVARMRLSMPATTDYWANDGAGDPLFVVTAKANAGLVRMLPEVLDEARAAVGDRRLTVVFDRGGYSPKLFERIMAAGFDFITYRKGRCAPIARRHFGKHRARVDGRTVRYVLADREVCLGKARLRLRQVTRLSDNGHQTRILTSRRDLAAAAVAYRMFGRWRQENFFKYLRQEYAIDALAEYAAEPDDPLREVPNPAWAALDAQLRGAHARAERLQAEYGLEALTNPEARRRTMRGFKIARGKLARQIEDAWLRVETLHARRDALPRRVPIQSVMEEPVLKLAPELQHLTNLVKMVACQAESDLFRALAPHYRRAEEEGRTLLQSAFNGAADIQVTRTELRVTLAPLSSPHRTRAIAALCEELNASATLFPGSNLRLRYAIHQP
jgi:transposase